MTQDGTRQPLDGIRILDLTWGVAGPLGVLLLAEHGADVVKVEPPGGDPFRDYEGYRCWNRSRRSVELDLKAPEGAEAFRRLLTTADVVVESFRPGVMDRLGFGWDAIRAVNERTVLLSVPAYPDGHRHAGRPGYDALVQASSGEMWEQPGWRPGPVFLHMPMPSMGAIYLVPLGVLAALSARERTGRGQHVETSLYQGVLLYTTQIWQDVEKGTNAFHELMGKSYPPGIHQAMIFECAGGEWLHYSVMSGLTPTKSLVEILGLTDMPQTYELMSAPQEERERINEVRRARFRDSKRADLIDEMRANNHAVEAIDPPETVFRHIQTIANDMAVTVDDPDVGPTTQMGVPIHLLGTPGSVRGPRPRLGAHTDEVLGEVAAAVPNGRTAGPAPVRGAAGLALDGIRLLDFGQYLAGPFGPMVLADLGADVVKIEPVFGDGMRQAGKPFFGCQRGKRSLALDLKKPQGLELALRLVAGADLVHHNMTRGVATRLGIDYAACRAARADVIYCNTYAYGLPDPLGRFGGLDPLYQASAGLEYEGAAVHQGNAPLYLRFGMTDASNALLSAVGMLLALVHRQRTGEGQELWTSLHDGGVIFSSDVWLGADGQPWPGRPRLDRDLRGISALSRLYRTQDDDWICIAAERDEEWRALVAAVPAAGSLLDDERLATPAGRLAHRQVIEAVLEPAFRTRTAWWWTTWLDDHGVPNEIPVNTHAGRLALHDSDNERLGLVTEYPHPILGRLRQFGDLITFSETPGKIWGPPPLVGQHSREILRGAGLRDGDIDTLVAEKVVYEPDDSYAERFTN
jgi:crotonobetainyl-CoA:carnitine CoA-transferase CaiB-like acyl-CoA transferase